MRLLPNPSRDVTVGNHRGSWLVPVRPHEVDRLRSAGPPWLAWRLDRSSPLPWKSMHVNEVVWRTQIRHELAIDPAVIHVDEASLARTSVLVPVPTGANGPVLGPVRHEPPQLEFQNLLHPLA